MDSAQCTQVTNVEVLGRQIKLLGGPNLTPGPTLGTPGKEYVN